MRVLLRLLQEAGGKGAGRRPSRRLHLGRVEVQRIRLARRGRRRRLRLRLWLLSCMLRGLRGGIRLVLRPPLLLGGRLQRCRRRRRSRRGRPAGWRRGLEGLGRRCRCCTPAAVACCSLSGRGLGLRCDGAGQLPAAAVGCLEGCRSRHAPLRGRPLLPAGGSSSLLLLLSRLSALCSLRRCRRPVSGGRLLHRCLVAQLPQEGLPLVHCHRLRLCRGCSAGGALRWRRRWWFAAGGRGLPRLRLRQTPRLVSLPRLVPRGRRLGCTWLLLQLPFTLLHLRLLLWLPFAGLLLSLLLPAGIRLRCLPLLVRLLLPGRRLLLRLLPGHGLLLRLLPGGGLLLRLLPGRGLLLRLLPGRRLLLRLPGPLLLGLRLAPRSPRLRLLPRRFWLRLPGRWGGCSKIGTTVGCRRLQACLPSGGASTKLAAALRLSKVEGGLLRRGEPLKRGVCLVCGWGGGRAW